MTKKLNLLGYGIIGICLVLVLTLAVGCTVAGRSREAAIEREQYLAVQEREVANELRSYLSNAGYADCGINITHLIDAEGSRSYTVLIHHQDLYGMEESELARLTEGLHRVVDGNEFLGMYSRYISFF